MGLRRARASASPNGLRRRFRIVQPHILYLLVGIVALIAFVPVARAEEPVVETLVFTPTDDAYVSPGKPDTNFGSKEFLLVDASSERDFLLRFDVAGIAGRTVLGAVLRLYAIDPSNIGGEFHLTDGDTWDEHAVTWSTAPAASGTPVAALATVLTDTWYEIDLSAVVQADGPLSLRTTSPSGNGADYRSKEFNGGSHAPQLSVTVETGPPDTEPPTVPGPLIGTATNGDQVDLEWGAAGDNVGVHHYEVYRDGALLGSTATTSLSDGSVHPDTSYGYHVVAVDAAGNVSQNSNTVVVQTPLFVNTPPLAKNDVILVTAGESSQLDVLANDSDAEGNMIPGSLTIVAPPASGQAAVDPLRARSPTRRTKISWGRTRSATP